MQALEPYKHQAVVIMAPGNHDLSAFRDDGEFGSARSQEAQFLAYQLALAPALKTASPNNDALLKSAPQRPPEAAVDAAMKEWLSCAVRCGSIVDSDPKFGQMLRQSCAADCREAPSYAPAAAEERWVSYWEGQKLFPIEHIDVENRLAIFALSSAGESETRLGTNAIGAYGLDQLERLEDRLRRLPNVIATVIVLSHHPIALNRNEPWGWNDWLVVLAIPLAHPSPARFFVMITVRHRGSCGISKFSLEPGGASSSCSVTVTLDLLGLETE